MLYGWGLTICHIIHIHTMKEERGAIQLWLHHPVSMGLDFLQLQQVLQEEWQWDILVQRMVAQHGMDI